MTNTAGNLGRSSRAGARPSPGTVSVSLLYVVSRDAPDTYAYLKEAFAGIEQIEVVFDRRKKERRGGSGTPGSERRRQDRRRKSIRRELDRFGWLLVKR